MSRPQNNLNLTSTIKIAIFLPQKAKKIPLYKIKFKARIKGDIENVCCSATWVNLKLLPKLNVNLSQPQLNSTSTQFQINFNSNSFQSQPQINLSVNINLNSIWLWHKSNPILCWNVLENGKWYQSEIDGMSLIYTD